MLKTLVLAVFAAVLTVSFGRMMTGGWTDRENDDSGGKDALRFAINSLNRESNDLYLHDYQEVVSIKSQVVSGMKYIITARMAKTTCKKSNPAEQCPFHEDTTISMPYECTFTVWAKAWENFYEVLKKTCGTSSNQE